MTTLAEDLRKLRHLKDMAELVGSDKKERDAAFKRHQAKCLQRMEAEGADSFRTAGYQFTPVAKVKGAVEDRTPYIRWALENDEGIVEFLLRWSHVVPAPTREQFEHDFYDAIMNTSVVSYKENGHVMNQQARAHIDNEQPLPPGLTFRPDPSISMTKS